MIFSFPAFFPAAGKNGADLRSCPGPLASRPHALPADPTVEIPCAKLPQNRHGTNRRAGRPRSREIQPNDFLVPCFFPCRRENRCRSEIVPGTAGVPPARPSGHRNSMHETPSELARHNRRARTPAVPGDTARQFSRSLLFSLLQGKRCRFVASSVGCALTIASPPVYTELVFISTDIRRELFKQPR